MKVAFAKKIALLGDPQVGKTSLQSRYLGLGFKETYTPTLGANFSVKDYQSKEGTVRVNILDLAGQFNFKQVRKNYFSGVSGCLLVFDVTRPYSAEQQILPFVEEILEFTNDEGIPLAVIGNKIDLEFIRQVHPYEGINASVEAKEMLDNPQLPVEYFETSAKEGAGVKEAFNWLIEQILQSVS